jgi:hypothetical protein
MRIAAAFIAFIGFGAFGAAARICLAAPRDPEPDVRTIQVSVEDGFAARGSSLPSMHVELGGVVLHDGPLVETGSPLKHRYYGLYTASVPNEPTTLRVRVPSRHIDWSRQIDLSRGAYLYIYEGHGRAPVELVQEAERRYYK